MTDKNKCYITIKDATKYPGHINNLTHLRLSIRNIKFYERVLSIHTLFEGVVDVEQGQVVPIDVGEPHFGLVRCLLSLGWAHKALWD